MINKRFDIRILCLLLCFLVMTTGCVWPKKPKKPVKTEEETATGKAFEPEVEETVTSEIKKGNAITVQKIGFYAPNRTAGTRELQTGYVGDFARGKDMAEYSVFYTDEPSISYDYFKTVWESYRDKYVNAEQYKIGYEILFSVSGESVKKNIFKPSDTESYSNYIKTYLFDDVHQTQGQWYGPLSDSDMNGDTILTAIKLAGGADVDKIDDEIIITAFIYLDEKDFDSVSGEYTGTCKKSISYRRKTVE